jgi:hypothetical protein
MVEWKFHIHAYTKATIPMSRLAEYLLDLADILGEKHSVHFDRIEDGSAVPVVKIEQEAEPKVRNRVYRAQNNEAPKEALEAKARIERRLVADNATGAELVDPMHGFKLLQFRGRERTQQPWGPIRQAGELIGTVIGIGGKNDPVSVHLEDGGRTYVCRAKREVARKLRPFLFETPVRVRGYGRWMRNDQGEWILEEFTIADFDELDPAPLRDVLDALRAVKSDWLDGADPLAELRKLNET